jgi:hypothetical protein
MEEIEEVRQKREAIQDPKNEGGKRKKKANGKKIQL